MNELQIFNYTDKPVRTITKDGEPWFAASDVCDILELGNATMAVSRLSEKMKGLNSIDTPGGKQYMIIISEAGLYKMVFTSRKPEAEKFTEWVTSRSYSFNPQNRLLFRKACLPIGSSPANGGSIRTAGETA